MSPCERCYGSNTACTRCVACVNVEAEHCYGEELDSRDCANECPVEFRTINPELFNYCGESVSVSSVPQAGTQYMSHACHMHVTCMSCASSLTYVHTCACHMHVTCMSHACHMHVTGMSCASSLTYIRMYIPSTCVHVVICTWCMHLSGLCYMHSLHGLEKAFDPLCIINTSQLTAC